VLDRGEGQVSVAASGTKSSETCDLVAVAHPDVGLLGHAGEQFGLGDVIRQRARPYSRGPARSSTWPPSAWQASCMP
jgi:hypothetical protein